MPTIAMDALNWLEAHSEATSEQKRQLLDQVPAWQWATPGGHWYDLSKHCSNRVDPALERRPANALCIEIGTPMPRCLFREPGGSKEGRSNLAYLLSGGSILAYGICEQAHCFNCGRE
jgi:hypothetical protein